MRLAAADSAAYPAVTGAVAWTNDAAAAGEAGEGPMLLAEGITRQQAKRSERGPAHVRQRRKICLQTRIRSEPVAPRAKPLQIGEASLLGAVHTRRRRRRGRTWHRRQ